VIKNAFILAAGIGSRMRGIINHPKCMIIVQQKSLIEHILIDLHKAGVENIIINTHYCAEILESHILSLQITADINITFVREEIRLETAASIYKSMHLFNSDYFFTVNTDSFWYNPTYAPALQLYDFFEKNSSLNIEQLLLMKNINDAIGINGEGDFNLKENGQAYFSKNPQYVYTGMSIVNKKFFYNIPTDFYSIGSIWKDKTKQDNLEIENVFGTLYTGTWIHIGDPETKKYIDNLSL
jgi:N-acetyl-alpha-D-muramate 1-phosphate uridylyltransferase